MAVTRNTYTGDGSTVLFSFTFPYLDTADIKVTLNSSLTTAYTLANATTIQFDTAPANGDLVVIYRQTDDGALNASFYPGSAIRSQDLNDNFTQNLYVTQEAVRDSLDAVDFSSQAVGIANGAVTTANAASATATTAASDAAAAVATANTADTNASAAVVTANTADTNASAAVVTANSAASDAATALSTANTALSTANTADTNASTALTTANTALADSAAAVSTANTASTNASAAVSTANTADTNASSAVSTANTALSTANAAASAVASAVLYVTVANVASIPGSPSNNDAVEVIDSTGIESFTPLSGVPAGFVGDSGLSVRMVYTTSGATWNWIQYYANDTEARYGDPISQAQTDILALDSAKLDATTAASTYLAKAGDTMTGAVGVVAGTAAAPGLHISGDTDTGIYGIGANELGIATNGTARITIDNLGEVIVKGGLRVNDYAVFDNNVYIDNTGILRLPVGTTAQRPGTPAAGDIRFNSTDVSFEGYNGSAWSAIGGGAVGGGTDKVFYENDKTVTTNYTLTTNKNAVTAGPVTINSGITVTVPSGSNWVVV